MHETHKERISVLLLALTLLLTILSGCGSTTPAAAGATAAPTAAAAEVPAAEDPAAAPADAPVIEGLTFTEESPLKYATVFRLFRYEGGYTLIRIDNGGDFLVVPEGAAVPAKMDSSVTVLQQPLDKIYLAATSAMSLFAAVDALDHIRLTGTRESGWYIDAAVEAMQRGDIEFAGKYSEPDYERLIDEECDLAIESTMIYHTPKVKEMIEDLGIPVLVDRSSYEQHPLGRTEWIKLYAALVGKDAEAAEFFDQQAAIITQLEGFENTGRLVAFFFVNLQFPSSSASPPTIPKMIECYALKTVTDQTNTSVSVTMRHSTAPPWTPMCSSTTLPSTHPSRASMSCSPKTPCLPTRAGGQRLVYGQIILSGHGHCRRRSGTSILAHRRCRRAT